MRIGSILNGGLNMCATRSVHKTAHERIARPKPGANGRPGSPTMPAGAGEQSGRTTFACGTSGWSDGAAKAATHEGFAARGASGASESAMQ
jgi:hypothetical protein